VRWYSISGEYDAVPKGKLNASEPVPLTGKTHKEKRA
jgi:hypothetical protein